MSFINNGITSSPEDSQRKSKATSICDLKDEIEKYKVLKQLFKICANFEDSYAHTDDLNGYHILCSRNNNYYFKFSHDGTFIDINISGKTEEKTFTVFDQILRLRSMVEKQLKFELFEKKTISKNGDSKVYKKIRIYQIGPRINEVLNVNSLIRFPDMNPEMLHQTLENLTNLILFLLPEGNLIRNTSGPNVYNNFIFFNPLGNSPKEESFTLGINYSHLTTDLKQHFGNLYYNVTTSFIGIKVDDSCINGMELKKLLKKLKSDRNNRIHELIEWVIIKKERSENFTICFTAVNISEHFVDLLKNLNLE